MRAQCMHSFPGPGPVADDTVQVSGSHSDTMQTCDADAEHNVVCAMVTATVCVGVTGSTAGTELLTRSLHDMFSGADRPACCCAAAGAGAGAAGGGGGDGGRADAGGRRLQQRSCFRRPPFLQQVCAPSWFKSRTLEGRCANAGGRRLQQRNRFRGEPLLQQVTCKDSV